MYYLLKDNTIFNDKEHWIQYVLKTKKDFIQINENNELLLVTHDPRERQNLGEITKQSENILELVAEDDLVQIEDYIQQVQKDIYGLYTGAGLCCDDDDKIYLKDMYQIFNYIYKLQPNGDFKRYEVKQ